MHLHHASFCRHFSPTSTRAGVGIAAAAGTKGAGTAIARGTGAGVGAGGGRGRERGRGKRKKSETEIVTERKIETGTEAEIASARASLAALPLPLHPPPPPPPRRLLPLQKAKSWQRGEKSCERGRFSRFVCLLTLVIHHAVFVPLQLSSSVATGGRRYCSCISLCCQHNATTVITSSSFQTCP